jgi:Domain of unknown function (DUF4386)
MTSNPGRTAGIWYLLLILIGPLRLLYIPSKLIVDENAAATVNNIAAHQLLFRLGMVSELLDALMLIFLVLAFYRLFEKVDRHLSMLVVVLGGLMPAAMYLVNVTTDAGALMIVRGADFLSVFDKPQQDALALVLLRLHDHLFTATLLLAGAWLFPLGILVYRSRFLPRLVGVWLLIGGAAWLVMCFTGFLAPQYQDKEFALFQPAFLGEIALMLWLVIKGAKPPAIPEKTSSLALG